MRIRDLIRKSDRQAMEHVALANEAQRALDALLAKVPQCQGSAELHALNSEAFVTGTFYNANFVAQLAGPILRRLNELAQADLDAAVAREEHYGTRH